MEDVVLVEDWGEFAYRRGLLIGGRLVATESVGRPNEKRYLILNLGGEAHGEAMHEDAFLAERFAVV